ncbi:endonuclease domain-containing protein [Kineococcus arenarius]|uniref:endonuclease domain-containing protein n=1 Tax=unclassified Kineococcus TaxID=2621656 RepID=UPI003D7D1CA2
MPPGTDLAPRTDVLTGTGVDERLRLRAAASVLPPGAAIARRSAAAVHGFRSAMPHEAAHGGDVEVVLPVGSSTMRRPGIRSYSAVTDGDVVVLDGLPLTSALRTALDAARFEAPPVALAMLDLGLRRGLFSREQAQLRLAAQPGERGVARARRLFVLADPGAESPGESWLRLRCADAGFPPLTTQIEVPRGRGRVYRLDAGWPERRLAVEYDGREFHEGAAQRAHDERRRAHLARLGWTVVAVGAGEVLGRSLHLERGLGELLGVEPRILTRTW